MRSLPELYMRDAGEERAVCLDEIVFPALASLGKELSSSHRFYRDCIDKWSVLHGACPLCAYVGFQCHQRKAGKNRENDNGGNGAVNDGSAHNTFAQVPLNGVFPLVPNAVQDPDPRKRPVFECTAMGPAIHSPHISIFKRNFANCCPLAKLSKALRHGECDSPAAISFPPIGVHRF
ncbi:hypothetical protein KSP40_PGU016568 [Platanthera guangdongensis]|uniref:Uncharacterized protein n=1 Tax=Platanthera guangdongensis TaxID=2320717 RepID=A0ABR2LR91_9ASPA